MQKKLIETQLNTLYEMVRKLVVVLLLLPLAFWDCSSISRTKNSTTTASSKRASAKKSLAFREAIVDQAKDYVGAPYRSSGTNPKTGFDCSGFTSYILKKFQVEVNRDSRSQAAQGKKIELNKVKQGDLLFFGANKNAINHVGMVVSNDEGGLVMIHSSTSRGVVIENISSSDYWQGKLLFARDVLLDRF
jgi:cell wall-associated NlpC family hydrolase